MSARGTLFVVSAPSGAGKTTLINSILADLKSEFALERVITYTTKEPREGEVPGKDYHYISKDQFEMKVKEGFFLEWSTDYRAYYGTPADIRPALELGTSQILVIDRRGAQQVLAQIPEAVLIWLHTIDLAVLEQRLRNRGTESEGQIVYRISRAKIEIEAEYSKRLYAYHILNDVFDEAFMQLKSIMIDEMKSRFKK